MKPLGSSLNPYASSYIPLSKREPKRTFIAESSSKDGNGSIFPGYYPPYMRKHHGEKAPVAVSSAVKNHSFHGSVSHHSNELTEMEMLDREINMELEFLQASFPGLSEQSLIDVYLTNKGDLDATIDMLNQLENKHPPDFDYDSESLPDTLDIGDISESGFGAVGQKSFKMKNVGNGASTSSRF